MHIELSDPNLSTLQLLSPIALPKPLIPSHRHLRILSPSTHSLPLFLYLFHSCFPFLLLPGSCCKERGRVQLIDSTMQFTASSSSFRIECGMFLMLKPSVRHAAIILSRSFSRGQPVLQVKYVPRLQQVQMSYPLVKRLQH